MEQSNYSDDNQQPEALAFKKPTLGSKISSKIKQHKWLLFILTSFGIASVTLIVLLNSVEIPVSSWKVEPYKRPPAPVYYASLSGLKVETEEQVNKPITAFMIPNDNYGARPQSGIGQAEVVFEAIAEGGITRFMALYQTNQPNLIGPIRSVRPYYLYWATPFQPSIVQTGGSARAYQIMRSDGYRDIGYDNNSKYYWRDKSRKAPNNVYTSFEKINQLNQAKGHTTSSAEMFLRQDGKPAETKTATNLNVKISSSQIYNSSYSYDETSNEYIRSQNGQVHADRETGPIKVNAVIVIKVIETKVLEDGYRENIEVVGEGQAYVFQNGQITQATWKKLSPAAQIRFYDANGTEIAINRGKVWISAIPINTGNVTWQ